MFDPSIVAAATSTAIAMKDNIFGAILEQTVIFRLVTAGIIAFLGIFLFELLVKYFTPKI